jgi:DNA-binding NarL/FixJ family response regulator
MTDSLMTVMLVDDHSVVRTGYRMLLEMTGDFSVVSEVESGDAAVDQYNLWRPSVVVIDLNLPGISGIEATRRIIQIDGDAKVLVFSIHDESIYVTRSFDAGASGYLCKSCSPGEMVEAVRTVASGKLFTGSNLRHTGDKSEIRGEDSMRYLSAREFEVFQLLGRGQDSRDIANSLGITAKTVSNYVILIKEKLALSSTSELVSIATQFIASHRPIL